MNFDIEQKQRKAILEKAFERLDHFYENTESFQITPKLDRNAILSFINNINLKEGINYEEAIDVVTNGLEKYSVHTPHSKYFGLFNPRANFAGIIADLITAAYNPQLAAWSHAPFAVEIEIKIVQELANKFGFDLDQTDGVFTTGGAEANLTALLCALNSKYPKFAKEGMFGLSKMPLIFCSEEAHHSVQKAARVVGLGSNAVITIPTTERLSIDIDILEKKLDEALLMGGTPLMIIGTGGTTGTGAIDDLDTLNQIAEKYNCWFHVDAAYGGGAILSNELRHYLKGISKADSITFDAHKWMSVPMGASIFLTSHPDILSKTFRITTEYMPKESAQMKVVEPFSHSIQWSRRFIGLKVYLSLLFYGWDGYETIINHQTHMGQLLREKLIANGWILKNNTPLPIICFTDAKQATDHQFIPSILERIIAEGKSWLSLYPVKGVPTLRACITNYNTKESDLDEFIAELNKERATYKQKNDEYQSISLS